MADVRQLNLTSRDVMSNLTLRVAVGRGFALRTRLAMALIRLAGWVLTVPVEVDFVERLDERNFDGAKALPPDQRRIEFTNGKLLVSFWVKDGFRVWAQAVIRAPAAACADDALDGWRAGCGRSGHRIGERGPGLEATRRAPV